MQPHDCGAGRSLRCTKVLVVAGEKDGAAHLVAALGGDGFDCEVSLPEDARQRVLDVVPGVVVLDVPSIDSASLALCDNLRGIFGIPLVVCSISSREWDIVRAFEAGADDYILLPTSPAELRARLHAMVRRSGAHDNGHSTSREIIAGDLQLYRDEHRVYRRGQPVDLSPIEFRLLLSLVQESGRPVSHRKLLFSVWGPEYMDSKHYLRLYVRYLRSKLEDDPEKPELILNEWGIGYRFQPKLEEA